MKEIIKKLSYFVYAVIILALLIEVPIVFGYYPLAIIAEDGGQVYSSGSLVYHKTTSFGELKAGDIVSFEEADGNVAVRQILEKDEDNETLKVKGDTDTDTVVISYNVIFGRVKDFALPVAGYFIYIITQWYVFLVLVVILAINLVLELKRVKEAKEEPDTAAAEPVKEKVQKEKKQKEKIKKDDITAADFFKDI